MELLDAKKQLKQAQEDKSKLDYQLIEQSRQTANEQAKVNALQQQNDRLRALLEETEKRKEELFQRLTINGKERN